MISDKVKKYYDQEVEDYVKMYQEGYTGYPANYIRMKIMLERMKQYKVQTVLDIGCGTGLPMIQLLKSGLKCKGIDFSEEMVKRGMIELTRAGFDENLITQGDIEQGINLPNEKFDAIIAFGVFPHITNEQKTLEVIKKLLNPKGKVFIEFRNDLFAAFTFNKYSLDFFLNRVINFSVIPESLHTEVSEFFRNRLNMDKTESKDPSKLQYTDIFSKFHNPLTINELFFGPAGFNVDKIHFYHYHALPPIFESKYPDVFRKLSLEMEDPADWRGYFMASAFFVEASRHD